MFHWVFLFLAFLTLGFGCSESNPTDKENTEEVTDNSDSDESNDVAGSLAIKELGDYPYTTESVTDAANLADELAAEVTSFDSTSGSLELPDLGLRAQAGVSLGPNTTSSTFSGNNQSSYGACEMVNRARRFLFEAANGDAWKCRLDVMSADDDFEGLVSENEKIIRIAAGEGEEYRVKVKFDLAEDVVKGFTIWQCEGDEQTGYLTTSIDPSTLNYDYSSKSITEPDNEDVDKTYLTISAKSKVDENGNFVGIKEINNVTSNIFANGWTSFNRYQIQQSSLNVLFAGVQTQSNQGEPTRFVAFHELIDLNTEAEPFALANLAIGNGAIAMSNQGATAFVQGWNGDTALIDSEVTQIEKIQPFKDNLPEATTPSSIAFSGDEVWDCDTTGAINFADTGLTFEDLSACSGFELDQNDYLQCQQISSQQGID